MLGVWSQELTERRRTAELEGQAERIGAAAQGVIDGAGQLEQTAAAVARLNERLEQKAERLSGVAESIAEQRPSTQSRGVAEVVLRKIAPNDLARYEAQIAEAKATEPPIEQKQGVEQDEKRRRRRQIYQEYAVKFAGKSERECDRLVVRHLMSELLSKRSGRKLRDSEIGKVGSILLQGPVAQQLKQTQGEDAGIKYAMGVLAKAQKVVEKAQRRSRDRGIEM